MGRDKVGYGRPPKANQLKPGKSGNPKGRPKGSLNLVTDLAAELTEQITVREDGRTRLSKQRALIKSLLAKGIQGDVRAAAAILALYAKVNVDGIDDGSKSLDDAELAILKRFGPRLLKSLIGKDDVS
jgi:Family of unknown function (DUF5681)